MSTTTCPSQDELHAYSIGLLSDEASDAIAADLASCADCRSGLSTLRRRRGYIPVAIAPACRCRSVRGGVPMPSGGCSGLRNSGVFSREPVKPVVLRKGPWGIPAARGVGPAAAWAGSTRPCTRSSIGWWP